MASEHLTKETGEISTEKSPVMYVEWKVPQNLLLNQDTNHSIQSPSFRFKKATWNLRLIGDNRKNSIHLALVKKNPATSTLCVSYNMGTRNVFGQSYNNDSGEISSKFERNLDSFVMHSQYRQNLSQRNVASNGVVTFFCYFWVESEGNLDELLGKKLFEDQSKKITCELVTENIGEISTETSLLTYVEWEVPDKILLSQEINRTIDSPSFQFNDATWYLNVTKAPVSPWDEEADETIELHLWKKDFSALTSDVGYKVGIKTVDGNSYWTDLGERHKTFDSPVWKNHLSTLDEKVVVSPNGVVTFFCYFWFNFGCLEAVSTTKTPEGLEKLGTDFENLFISGEDSDVIIRVKDKEFKAHKCVLRARSTVFNSMFTHDMAEKNSGTVDIVDCHPNVFETFLLYIYSGNMENLSTKTVFDLYGAADKYDAEELKLKCKEFILSKISLDTVCDVIEHALQYDEAELLKTATVFFAKHFKKVILTVKWQSFLKNNPVATNELLIKASNFFEFKEQ